MSFVYTLIYFTVFFSPAFTLKLLVCHKMGLVGGVNRNSLELAFQKSFKVFIYVIISWSLFSINYPYIRAAVTELSHDLYQCSLMHWTLWSRAAGYWKILTLIMIFLFCNIYCDIKKTALKNYFKSWKITSANHPIRAKRFGKNLDSNHTVNRI